MKNKLKICQELYYVPENLEDFLMEFKDCKNFSEKKRIVKSWMPDLDGLVYKNQEEEMKQY